VSLRRQLLFALLGSVLLSGMVAAGATYYFARAEVDGLLDEELRQVALSLREHALLDLSRFSSPANFEQRVVVQIWDRHGFTYYLSNASTPLPLSRSPGYSTIPHEGREWRMYTLNAGGQTIQTAQAIAERTERATAAALRTLMPILAAMPLLALLIWLVLERGFAPLSRLAAAVRARHSTALEPLPAQGVPAEIAPLVSALNSLLARLDQTFTSQRRFAADAAHELRTPLTALALQIQLVERARSHDERAAAITRLSERVKRATRVIEQLLVLARLEPEAAQKPAQAVSLPSLARVALADAAPLAEQKRISLALGREEPVTVTANEDSLRILCTNLLDNAIRYTPSGGHIQVRAYHESGSAILEVADDGPGIPLAERERVFDRFYRGQEVETAGSGLGLAIARQIAELHGGSIELGAGLGGQGLSARLVMPAS
jgi:two-component system OmpR family sensor kinase